jgi:hypothetical protein
MLIEEARWFASRIAELDPGSIYPMANVGSSTAHFRQVEQPWIDQLLFAPARAAGHAVVHLDLKAADGVDLVGDLGDPAFIAQARGRFRSLLCSNLLEHVVDRGRICAHLLDLVAPGGFLFLSVPRRYPEHRDPIDTGFRPSVEELAAELADTRAVAGEVVVGERIGVLLARQPSRLLPVLLPFYQPDRWWMRVKHWGWALRRPHASCVLLQKQPA